MKREDIRYEVTELTGFSRDLDQAETKPDIDSNMMRLYYKMNELLSEPEYANSAEEIIQNIESYQEGNMSKQKVVHSVTNLIETMQKDFLNQPETGFKKSIYEKIREYDPKKGEENKMSANNPNEIIAQLKAIRRNLEVAEDFYDIEMYMKRLTEIAVIMRDMESAQEMRKHITRYYMNKLEMEDLLDRLDEFIEAFQIEVEERSKCESETTVGDVCEEVKNVCVNAWSIMRKEAGAACRDIRKTIREETPNCANAIGYIKDTPKRAEKAIKGGIRKWLFSDEEE